MLVRSRSLPFVKAKAEMTNALNSIDKVHYCNEKKQGDNKKILP